MIPAPYLTTRDMARLEDAREEIQRRPDVASITVRVENGDIHRYFMSGSYLLIDIRPEIRTPTKIMLDSCQ